jgi:hypothetical protein
VATSCDNGKWTFVFVTKWEWHDQCNNYQFRQKEFAPRSLTAVRLYSREEVGMDSGGETLSPRSMTAEGARKVRVAVSNCVQLRSRCLNTRSPSSSVSKNCVVECVYISRNFTCLCSSMKKFQWSRVLWCSRFWTVYNVGAWTSNPQCVTYRQDTKVFLI